MKPELRCHAVLCKKQSEPQKIVDTLTSYLQAALQEYKREKLAMQKARKNNISSNGELLPRRKMILQTGTLNFRPPVNRSKSAPRLGSIDEEDEFDEEEEMEEQNASVSDYEFDEVGLLLFTLLVFLTFTFNFTKISLFVKIKNEIASERKNSLFSLRFSSKTRKKFSKEKSFRR